MKCNQATLQSFNRMSARRFLSVGLLTALLLSNLTPSSAQAAACTRIKYDLPASYALQLTDSQGGSVVHLRRANYQYKPTVHIWIQHNYRGHWYIPQNVYDIQVQMETRLVLETFNGKVRQVYKQVSIVRACSNWRVTRV